IDKPVLCSFMGIVDVSEGIRYLEENHIPNYAFPEEAIRAMNAMLRFGSLLKLEKRRIVQIESDREKVRQIICEHLSGKDKHFMSENEANEILSCYGFPLLKSQLVKGPSQLEDAVEDIGFPLAMKIISPDIVHKFDAGGVRLKIKTLKEARESFQQIIVNAKNFDPNADIKGVLVEEMARSGIEVILGTTRDPRFGPICMFGLGGTYVETHRDVSFRLAPMWEISAEIMIRNTNAYKIMTGIRGKPPSDIEAVKNCILKLSQMVTEHPEIAELDINPLIVYPEGEGCVVADSRILLRTKPV
ncbi:MAG: acetate--CoA ligase family protein, partial [Deltaproteobacteria bacterium]|nr:acetate--CoA ligase family protein [Deltaproteobacteria bacterium]MBW2322916.1 acetate--CoA ligase family protein [Deltaproteobacteria bacterium]